jgi:hypothetical protein
VEFRWNKWNTNHIAQHSVSPELFYGYLQRPTSNALEETMAMSDITSSNKRKNGHKHVPASKPYWEMTSAELSKSTAEFDQELVGKTFRKPNAAQKARLAKAKRKRGRPQLGQGVQVISVSLEKGLLRAVDKLAKEKKAKRAELITFGLQAILNGDLPVMMH